jgi:hypothetical protein
MSRGLAFSVVVAIGLASFGAGVATSRFSPHEDEAQIKEEYRVLAEISDFLQKQITEEGERGRVIELRLEKRIEALERRNAALEAKYKKEHTVEPQLFIVPQEFSEPRGSGPIAKPEEKLD